MRINNVMIENFGIYQDACHFEFNYQKEKRVTLLKGENGSGKTTFLNAIKTVLYGPMLFGSRRTGNLTYSAFIESMLNSEAKKDPFSKYSIEINFATNMQNFSGLFTLNRAWRWQGKKLIEDISIVHKGIELTPEGVNEFFSVYYKLYPLQLFELFYLDGEKIDQLSIFESDIKELIDSNMNIDLFKTLKSDLEIYISKKHSDDDLKKLSSEKEYCLSLKEHISQTITKLNNENEELILKTSENKELIQQYTNQLSSYNSDLSGAIKLKTEQLKSAKKDLQSAINESIPLILLAPEVNTLLGELNNEEINSNSKIIREFLNDDLKNEISKEMGLTFKNSNIETMFDIMKKKLNINAELLHDISSSEITTIRDLLRRVDVVSKSSIHQIMRTYSTLQKDVRELSDELSKYDKDQISQLIDKLTATKIEYEQSEERKKDLKNKVEVAENQLSSLTSKIKAIEENIWKAIKSENINDVVVRINTVLEDYIKEIKKNKIHLIEKYTKDMFESLIRKKNFVERVMINNEGITILTKNNTILPLIGLSSGERQLFILSIIYSLIKTSERSTPLIFDSLLARLDKNHKQEVVAKFIKQCPDQVILLATDSELENIDTKLLDSMVNTKYSIDMSKSEKRILVNYEN